MKKNIKVIISTLGPLHLIKAAEFLNKIVDVKVIQGWIPSWWNRWLLYIANYFQHRNIFCTIKKRTPESLKGRNHGIAIPDMFYWACRLFGLISNKKASYWAAQLYGMMQQKYIKDADVFHVRSGSGSNGAIKKAKQRRMKVVVDHSIAHPAFMDKQLRHEYNKNCEEFDMGLDSPFWREIVEECKEGDVVLVNSQFVKDTFIENGFPSDKIKVVLQGVRSDFYSLKTDYDILGPLHILFTGGFGFRKGAEYILCALRELDKIGFQYEFTVVGDFSGAIPLIEKYTPKNMRLINTIPQDELKQYLRESDVYLFPSLCEGCASSGMEALAAGLPVIATRESGLPIENGIDGIIVESKNVNAIIDALQTILTNKSLRESLGQHAAKKISVYYTWDKYAENVVAIYEELLKEV